MCRALLTSPVCIKGRQHTRRMLFMCCRPSSRGRGRNPSPRMNPKVAPQVSFSSSIQPDEEAPKEGVQHSSTVRPPILPVNPIDNQASSSSGSYAEPPLEPANDSYTYHQHLSRQTYSQQQPKQV